MEWKHTEDVPKDTGGTYGRRACGNAGGIYGKRATEAQGGTYKRHTYGDAVTWLRSGSAQGERVYEGVEGALFIFFPIKRVVRDDLRVLHVSQSGGNHVPIAGGADARVRGLVPEKDSFGERRKERRDCPNDRRGRGGCSNSRVTGKMERRMAGGFGTCTLPYLAAIALLGISTCLTANEFFHFLTRWPS